MKKLNHEKQLQKRQRLGLLMLFIWILIGSLAVAQLFISNRLTDLGEKIDKEKKMTDLLIAENRLLEEELREKESLSNISLEAQKLGFAEVKSIYYLVPQIPVAMNPQPSAPKEY